MKFHYNRNKIIVLPFMVTMSAVAILKISNPKCTTTHAKDHSCEISLLSDQTKYFLTFMVIMEMVVIFKMPNHKCTYTHHKDHSCDVSLQSDQKL
jgi:hypothetical protein